MVRRAEILLLALGATLAGCQSAVELDFELTAPAAPVEIVPVLGDFVDVAWRDRAAADDTEHLGVSVHAVSTSASGAEAVLAVAELTRGSARYVVPSANPMATLAPGVYLVTARVLDGDRVVAEDLAPGLLVMQGALFRDAELTFTADLAQRDIWMSTVTASVARATIYLTADGGVTRLVISEGIIASDLAAVGRVVAFTGRTVDDVAIPAGDYQAVIELKARGGTVVYERGGLVIRWQP